MHSKPVGCCLKGRQQQGKDSCYELSQSDIISGVHTAPCTGQWWSWHRRETGWQPRWTALALIKEALKKDHRRRTLNSCQHYFFHSDMVHSGAIFITQILQLQCLCPLYCRLQIFSITPHSSHIYLWHSPTLDQAFLLFHSFDILPCIHLPLPLPLPFVPDFFPIIFIFLSCTPRGSSVITVFFGMRMSFHRGTGRGRDGGSSRHARVLVIRTMWLCSRERPYWRRTSDDTFC